MKQEPRYGLVTVTMTVDQAALISHALAELHRTCSSWAPGRKQAIYEIRRWLNKAIKEAKEGIRCHG